MAYACKTSTARKIVGVIPYLPYSRQCKRYSLSFSKVPRITSLLLIYAHSKMKSDGQDPSQQLIENSRNLGLTFRFCYSFLFLLIQV